MTIVVDTRFFVTPLQGPIWIEESLDLDGRLFKVLH